MCILGLLVLYFFNCMVVLFRRFGYNEINIHTYCTLNCNYSKKNTSGYQFLYVLRHDMLRSHASCLLFFAALVGVNLVSE